MKFKEMLKKQSNKDWEGLKSAADWDRVESSPIEDLKFGMEVVSNHVSLHSRFLKWLYNPKFMEN